MILTSVLCCRIIILNKVLMRGLDLTQDWDAGVRIQYAKYVRWGSYQQKTSYFQSVVKAVIELWPLVAGRKCSECGKEKSGVPPFYHIHLFETISSSKPNSIWSDDLEFIEIIYFIFLIPWGEKKLEIWA